MQRVETDKHPQAELKWEGQPADSTQTELKNASHLQQDPVQPSAMECCSKEAQTDMALQESKLTQTCLSAVTQQTQTVSCERLQTSQLTQTPVLLHHLASTQTEQHEACTAQQAEPAQAMQEAASTQTEQPMQEAAWTLAEQSVQEAALTQTGHPQEAASTQTEQHAQQASLSTQTPVPLQQPGSTQTEDMGSQMSQHTQTPLLLQCTAAAQAGVETAEAASQSDTQAQHSRAAEQQGEALHGEVMGLQLKVQSLQGIIDIQEQQLKAAAGQSSDAADQVGVHLLSSCTHNLCCQALAKEAVQTKNELLGLHPVSQACTCMSLSRKLSPQPKLLYVLQRFVGAPLISRQAPYHCFLGH